MVGAMDKLSQIGPGKHRHPPWLKVRAAFGEEVHDLKQLLGGLKLHTVCQEAKCPNMGECWRHGVATFMILGDVCTRGCRYCAVSKGNPLELDPAEPGRVAEAVQVMGLRHVVITSVDRDDLEDGGAGTFVLGLDSGGSCVGRAFRLGAEAAHEILAAIHAREMIYRVYVARQLPISLMRRTGRPRVAAHTYIADRAGAQYAGKLKREHIIELIRGGRGTAGEARDYLANTVHHLHQLGLPDSHLVNLLEDVNAED